MRSAGFHHTLMIDAPNWGQDWQFIMRNNAASIFASDPDRNLIFSIHMYSVFNTASAIKSYITTFVNNGLPLVIGEFGWNQASGDVDENSVMSYAQTYGIGTMGWSWSGNSGGAEYLDMVTNFDPSQRTSWGTRIITGANGLQQTAVEASVYSGILPTPTPALPAAPTNLAAKTISKSQINLTWTDNSNNESGFRIQRCNGSTCTNFALIASVGAGVQSYSNTGLTANTAYRYRIYAYNSAGNSGYSSIVTATTKVR